MEGKKTDLRKLFPNSRIPSIGAGLIILPYIPIGLLFACLRFCLLLNFLISRQILGLVLDEENAVFKAINHIFLMVLGVQVTVDGIPMHAQAIMCNKRSHIDGFVFSHSIRVYSEENWSVVPILRKALRLTGHKITSETFNSTVGKGPPVVIFPEMTPTSGVAIMQFDSSYFNLVKSVQPSAIYAWRILPIELCTANSGFLSDLFWTFFSPLTVYKITLCKTCIKSTDFDKEDFADAVANVIAKMLNVHTVPISHCDKGEYLKQIRRDKECARKLTISKKLLEMAKKVQEVAPHVPRDVIVNDLSRTNSVDVTLANIFEGVVKFTPLDKQNQEVHKPIERKVPQTSLEKRKAELYELARRRYKEKHGL